MKQKTVTRLLNKFAKSQVKAGQTEHEVTGSETSSTSPSVASPRRQPYRLPGLLRGLFDADLVRLCREVQDYQIVIGGMIKSVPSNHEVEAFALAQTIGVSLHPSPFPKALFHEACQIQTIFQRLYVAVAGDADWLKHTLQGIIDTDKLFGVLWSVYEQSASARSQGLYPDCKITAGIFRSDYMLHANSGGTLQLKQVEMNTISCAGAVHGQRTANMHSHLQKIGVYRNMIAHLPDTRQGHPALELPAIDNVKGICGILQTAHDAYVRVYREHSCSGHAAICLLMVVQPRNFNIADERPIEYALWNLDPPIPCFRVEWGQDLIDHTHLTWSGTLLFKHPHLREMYEVSVIYYRAGFEDREYIGPTGLVGQEARTRFEQSNAVNCPDILTHLVGSKKVQQALCLEGTLERFIDAQDAQKLRTYFMRMYPFDDTETGLEGKRLAIDPNLVKRYVLKPSRDGGSHNHYREDVATFLRDTPPNAWPEYVLMELIDPVVSENVLASIRGVWSGDVVSELGIWGGLVIEQRNGKTEMPLNSQIGWSVRSKNPNIDEMSVVKGYGCFDSVALIDETTAVDGAGEEC